MSGVPGGTNNQNGRLVFNNTRPNGTGLSIANAALGLYDTYAELGNRSYTPYRGHMIEFFGQDAWRATTKLRVEYGVRFSRIQPYYSSWGNMLVFDPASYDPAKAATLNPANGFTVNATLPQQYNGTIIPGNGWPDAAIGVCRSPPRASTTSSSRETSSIPKFTTSGPHGWGWRTK